MDKSNENKSSKPVILKSSFILQNTTTESNGSSKKEEPVNIFKNNPFAKVTSDEEETANEGGAVKEKKKEPGDIQSTILPKLNLFSNFKASSVTESSGFVFGQNLHERVVGEAVAQKESNSQDTKEEKGTGLLFSSSLGTTKSPDKEKSSENQEDPENPDEKPSTSASAANQEEINGCASLSSSNSNSLSLEEAAKKYEEARGAQKRKYDEVETITGEENEINILEINCKLFTFVDQNWEERGRGMLRLNDTKGENKQSRVVFRASGSLRVFLNTKVWNQMVCEQASQKSLRLTAIDAGGQLKIFLVMGRNEDINLLYNTLSRRINLEKKKKNEEKNKSEDEPLAKKSVVEEKNTE